MDEENNIYREDKKYVKLEREREQRDGERVGGEKGEKEREEREREREERERKRGKWRDVKEKRHVRHLRINR